MAKSVPEGVATLAHVNRTALRWALSLDTTLDDEERYIAGHYEECPCCERETPPDITSWVAHYERHHGLSREMFYDPAALAERSDLRAPRPAYLRMRDYENYLIYGDGVSHVA